MVDAGYSITEAVFSAQECDALTASLAVGDASQGRAGTRNLMRFPEVAALATDPRLLHLATEVLGGRAVVTMRPLLIHASSKARLDQPRRVVHIEYADCLDLGDGIRLAVA